MRMAEPIVIAIDIGGTLSKYGFINRSGKILFRGETETGTSADPGDLVGRLSALFQEELLSSTKYEAKGLGVGAPNANYFKGTVEQPANLNWKGVIPLAKLFEEKMSLPTVVTNDANAGALGELYFGAGRGMSDFIFITLGTGLGSGIIVNGELVYGRHGFAGELGHVVIIQHGRPCGCGRKGCLEQYCSATGIVKTYFEILRNDGRALPKELPIEEINAEYIYHRALGGDEAAFYAFNYTGEMLGFALANNVACLDPEAIFLFGGLAKAEELIFNPVKISFEKNLMNVYKGKVKILPSGLKDDEAALLGNSSIIWNKLKS